MEQPFDYFEIYKLRLNRFGIDYQSRIQGQRETNFEKYLLKSIYRVDFEYDGRYEPGTLERYKQDETRTLMYLLTRTSLTIAPGTVLMIEDKDGKETPWMVYYPELIQASGYNRYIMLKMSHLLTWTARDGSEQQSWAYFYGQENNMLKDEIRSRSRMDTIYSENLKLSFFIMPINGFIQKDDYFVIGEKPLQGHYRVTGFDIASTEGVEYVSVDPVYEYDLSNPPKRQNEDKEENFFWIDRGNK